MEARQTGTGTGSLRPTCHPGVPHPRKCCIMQLIAAAAASMKLSTRRRHAAASPTSMEYPANACMVRAEAPASMVELCCLPGPCVQPVPLLQLHPAAVGKLPPVIPAACGCNGKICAKLWLCRQHTMPPTPWQTWDAALPTCQESSAAEAATSSVAVSTARSSTPSPAWPSAAYAASRPAGPAAHNWEADRRRHCSQQASFSGSLRSRSSGGGEGAGVGTGGGGAQLADGGREVEPGVVWAVQDRRSMKPWCAHMAQPCWAAKSPRGSREGKHVPLGSRARHGTAQAHQKSTSTACQLTVLSLPVGGPPPDPSLGVTVSGGSSAPR